jgi:hypothetical protein
MLDIPVSKFFLSPLGSLSQLYILKTVEIYLPLLLSTSNITVEAIQNVMPASLERIIVREDGYNITNASRFKDVVNRLAMEKFSNPPRLKHVRLCVNLKA